MWIVTNQIAGYVLLVLTESGWAQYFPDEVPDDVKTFPTQEEAKNHIGDWHSSVMSFIQL